MYRIRAFGLDIYGCREALERLDDYVDHELSSDETRKVAQHLKLCHECARKFRFEAELVSGLRAKASQIAAPASPDIDALKTRIAALLAQEKSVEQTKGHSEDSAP